MVLLFLLFSPCSRTCSSDFGHMFVLDFSPGISLPASPTLYTHRGNAGVLFVLMALRCAWDRGLSAHGESRKCWQRRSHSVLSNTLSVLFSALLENDALAGFWDSCWHVDSRLFRASFSGGKIATLYLHLGLL